MKSNEWSRGEETGLKSSLTGVFIRSLEDQDLDVIDIEC